MFVFNDKKRTISGEIELKTLGLDPMMQYVSAETLGTAKNGRYCVSIELLP
jgi:hypothetical protein